MRLYYIYTRGKLELKALSIHMSLNHTAPQPCGTTPSRERRSPGQLHNVSCSSDYIISLSLSLLESPGGGTVYTAEVLRC